MLSGALPPLPRANVLDIRYDLEKRRVWESTRTRIGDEQAGLVKSPFHTSLYMQADRPDHEDVVSQQPVQELVPSFQEIRYLIEQHRKSAFNSESNKDSNVRTSLALFTCLCSKLPMADCIYPADYHWAPGQT